MSARLNVLPMQPWVMFINGAGGDVKPNLTDEYNFKRGEVTDAEHFGQELASSVLSSLNNESLTEVKGPFKWRLSRVQLPFDKSKVLHTVELESKIIPDFDYIQLDEIGKDEPTIILRKKKQAEFVAKKTESDWAKWLLDKLDSDGKLPEFVELEIQVLKFENLLMVGLAGEICSRVGLKVRDALKGRNHWLAGYSNGVAGYIASAEDYPLEEYEA